jgi:hypothetical protein
MKSLRVFAVTQLHLSCRGDFRERSSKADDPLSHEVRLSVTSKHCETRGLVATANEFAFAGNGNEVGLVCCSRLHGRTHNKKLGLSSLARKFVRSFCKTLFASFSVTPYLLGNATWRRR